MTDRSTPPAPPRIWVRLPDAAAVGPEERQLLREVVLEFCRVLRPADGVALSVTAAGASEEQVAAAVIPALDGLDEEMSSAGEILVHGGEVSAASAGSFVIDLAGGAPTGWRTDVRRLAAERSRIVVAADAVSVLDAHGGGQGLRAGVVWLVASAAERELPGGLSDDPRVELVRFAADPGLSSPWGPLSAAARQRGGGRWLKPLAAGDVLRPEAVDLMESVISQAGDVGLVVFETDERQADGVDRRWSVFEETRLVLPDEALRLVAVHGNWFGPSAGHLFSPEALDHLDAGRAAMQSDAEACLTVAAHLPVLYVKESIARTARSLGGRSGSRFHQAVDDAALRLSAGRHLAGSDPRFAEAVEGAVSAWVVSEAPREAVRARTDRRSVVSGDTHRPDWGPVIAVHEPDMLLGTVNFHGYAPIFNRRVARLAYLPSLARDPGAAARMGVVDGALSGPDWRIEVVTDAAELQGRADVLVSFAGRADLPHLAPPARFTGLKAYHVMDFHSYATAAAENLRSGGADLLLGYARHDRHSAFFRDVYHGFEDRVLPVPFGFADRFHVRTPFRQRDRRVLAMGAVNPVDDPLCAPGELAEYIAYHRGVQWEHAWRRRLLENADALVDVLDCRYPHFPLTKDPTPRSDLEMDAHQLFANDEQLKAFPPVRTYEGVAAGAVMVANRHPVYDELGFEDGVSALFHAPGDVDDFARVVRAAVADQDRLAAIAAAGTALVRSRYSHSRVADELYAELLRQWVARR